MRARRLTFVLLLPALLAACRQAAEVPAAEGQAAVREGRVSISGGDELASVLSWTLPVVEIDDPATARAAAAKALAHGDLFETRDSAIPILLALQRAAPGRGEDARMLEQARAALLEQARAALAAADNDVSLRQAQRHGTVLRTLWPQAEDVRGFVQAVDLAGRARDVAAAGEAALQARDMDGALDRFRQSLEVLPGYPRALRGFGQVEAALLDAAQVQAAEGDFERAQALVAQAQQVRQHPQTIAAAKARIEVLRATRVRQLRDEGLIALASADGLQAARERLAEMLRIARPGDPAALELRQRIELATHYGVFRPGQVFTDGMADGSRGPDLVVVPHGAFRMGAPADEPGAGDAERPQHLVRLDRGFAMTRHEITVGQYRRFVDASGYRPRATQRGHSMAYDVRSGNFVRGSGIDWASAYDGRPAAPDLPVIHVTARDAEAYAAWLSAQTGAHYRLPSEAEFEYALRAGSQTRYPWGDGPPPPGVENLTGGMDVSPRGLRWSNAFAGYGDGHWGPSPVGSFAANAFRLHDMAGNVSEWIADCWHQGYRRAPANGAAWVNPGCRDRMYRGGSWASAPGQVRSAWRAAGGSDVTNARVGFRLVRQL